MTWDVVNLAQRRFLKSANFYNVEMTELNCFWDDQPELVNTNICTVKGRSCVSGKFRTPLTFYQRNTFASFLHNSGWDFRFSHHFFVHITKGLHCKWWNGLLGLYNSGRKYRFSHHVFVHLTKGWLIFLSILICRFYRAKNLASRLLKFFI